MAKSVFSVAYVMDGSGGIWLGLKKARRLQRLRVQLGVGFYNGFGGLQKPDEPIEATARRETLAESGFEVIEMVRCGIGLIRHSYDPEEIELHLFLFTKHRGLAREIDEMIPGLFAPDQIPYNQMWPNDRHTLPLFLSGRQCVALFTIDREKRLTEPPKVKIVAALSETIDWKEFKF
jgi:8-oxo-dGTP pyrophosphatase MutT (NUDIX family)